jgi:hypothetical protein
MKLKPTVKVTININLASCLWPIVWLIAMLVI